MAKPDKSQIFKMAWDFVKRFGFSLSEGLKTAWSNFKFKKIAATKIIRFYFRKVDGSIREAFGTLREDLLPQTSGTPFKGHDCQVYYDTEKQEWRCFKKQNLLSICE